LTLFAEAVSERYSDKRYKMTEYVSNDKKRHQEECAAIPLHRWGEAEDIAGVAIMLASRAGGFITGQIIPSPMHVLVRAPVV